jgi:hypothetical protein
VRLRLGAPGYKRRLTSAIGCERRRRPADTRKRVRFALSSGPTLTGDANAEVPQGVVQLLDVSEHALGRMVRTLGGAVHAVPGGYGYCTPPFAFAYRTTMSTTPTPRQNAPISTAAMSRSVALRARTLGCRTVVPLSSALMTLSFQRPSLVHNEATLSGYSLSLLAGPRRWLAYGPTCLPR